MHSVPTSGPVALPAPPLQQSVDRFVAALGGPRKLLGLHPRRKGNSGNAAALNPAIVLGCIAAFEGFAEEFVAIGLAKTGASFAQIAKAVGKWNNPDLRAFVQTTQNMFAPSGNQITGCEIRVHMNARHLHSTWAEKPIEWSEAVLDASAWIQVRHALSHGLVSSWSAVHWPAPLRRDLPLASRVLRATSGGTHTLALHNAMNCGRIFTIGARCIADETAGWLGETLDWSHLPEFK